MGKLFGTDGVRGVANEELTCDLAFRLGQAAAMVLTKTTHHKPRILIGKDTRISSDMLEAAVTAGICSVGGDVYSLGVIPTPAVAYLVGRYNADAGVVISASHNPFEHNGIKLFNGEGYKLSDELESEIEGLMLGSAEKIALRTGAELGRSYIATDAVQDYVRHLYSLAETVFEGWRVAFDCANGAASSTLPALAELLGLEALVLSHEPDGVNINDNCGSTHPEALCEFVRNNRCKAGFAFDGDADRMLCVDENGELIDGDRVMAIFAKHMIEKGTLTNQTLVCTTMSNLGLFEMCKKYGIETKVTDVGDRYVLEEMLRGGHVLGGEASGHIIQSRFATTGDGEAAMVHMLEIMKESGKKLSELASVMERYPQVMVNVRVSPAVKKAYQKDTSVNEAIAKGEAELGDSGRIIVRASGTEPLVRVMIEGKDFNKINKMAIEIADLIQKIK